MVSSISLIHLSLYIHPLSCGILVSLTKVDKCILLSLGLGFESVTCFRQLSESEYVRIYVFCCLFGLCLCCEKETAGYAIVQMGKRHVEQS